jgi:hypothetical protein
MKTNKQNKTNTNTKTNSELKNRSEQRGETAQDNGNGKDQTATQAPPAPAAAEAAPQKTTKPYVNFAERDFNRKLPVEKVLEMLRRWLPNQYQLAEVVGKWIWIKFEEAPVERVRADLSQLGFHWNNTRKCWQHPCGETLPRGQEEPREKYVVWFPSAAANPHQYNGPARTAEQVAA